MYKHWKKVNRIIDKTIALDAPARIPFLEDSLSGNPELLSEAKDYLSYIEGAELAEFLKGEFLSESLLAREMSTAVSDNFSIKHIIGKQVGPYEIKGLLGEGGMGSVYRAERIDGEFTQQVAIKFLKSGFYSLYLRERFKREKKLLSKLHHPNIARLLDGGITDDGSPYLIMEYVEGDPVDVYCRKHRLNLEERLSLFLQICKAVQFAHSKLIIHRDLKPDNIFVTPGGQIKIMDFGIGKSLSPDIDEEFSDFTRPGNIIASFDFAAPEQLSSDDVSIQTDVYGLGALLYLLVTDQRVFSLKSKTIGEIEAVIRENTPERPGRVSSAKIGRISKDLDAIILKTLRKKPEDRYETVVTLMDDIDRLSNGLPVKARHGNLRYRTGKYIKRNKSTLAAAGLLTLFIFLFNVYHVNKLTAERNIAEGEAEKAQAITDFLTDIFESAESVQNLTDTLTVYDLLERGKSRINLMNDKPELQIEFTLAIGNSYKKIGSYEEADKLFKTADSLTQDLYGANSVQAANTAFYLGRLKEQTRSFEHAKFYYLKASELLEQHSSSSWNRIANVYAGLANVLAELEETSSADVYINRSIEIKELYNVGEVNLLKAKVTLAKVYRGFEKYEQAEKLYLEVLSELETQNNPDLNLLSITLNNLGYLKRTVGNFSDAEIYYKRSSEINSKLFGKDHPNSIIVLTNLANIHNELGNYGEALQVLKEVHSLTENRYGVHWRTGTAIGSVGRFHFERKEFDLAVEQLFESESIYREVLGAEHIWTVIENLYHHIALKNLGRFNESVTSLPAFKQINQKRDSFTYYDSIKVAQLIDKSDEFSIADLDDDIRQLKAILNR